MAVRRASNSSELRPLIVSLSTYAAPFNDGKLQELGSRVDGVTAVAGDVRTLWGCDHRSRSGDGYEVHVVDVRCGRSNATAWLVGLRSIAESVKPTVVHVESEPWQAVAIESVLLARDLHVPLGVHFAENGPLLRGPGGLIRRAGARWVLRNCSYAIGWSIGSSEVARRLAPMVHIATLPGTGVASDVGATADDRPKWFGPGSASAATIAYVGRFSPEKGLVDFLAIADALAERMPLRAAIAGGPSHHELVADWTAGRPWAYVHGILARPDVCALLAAADVLVCPSRTTRRAMEQFGKVPVEAMAVGTPVFAFDCGALSEVVGGGGVLVEEGARDELADAIERYLRSPRETRAALADRARAQAQRFTDSALAEKLVQLWTGI